MSQVNIEKKLLARNIKPTAMRQLVLKVLEEEDIALSLPEIEQRLEYADKSTIYRTLKLFEEKKLIHAIDDGTGATKYASCDDSCNCLPEDLHVHFLCIKCGKTYCFKDMPIKIESLPKNFIFESASFVIKGICAKCSTR